MLYSIFAYMLFHLIFLYLIGFTGDLLVPKSLNGPLTVPFWQAILTDASLIALFGLQHSIMARPAFKRWWIKIIPEPIERSTYLLFTFAALAILFYGWQPLGGIIWTIENPVIVTLLWVLFALGWGVVVLSSFLINHFDLFGLRQTWLYFQGKPYTNLPFDTPFLYKYVRHPLYLGLLISFWAAPVMSGSRLFFATLLTTYVISAIRLEERDLVTHFAEVYREYKRNVPMILPFGRKKKPTVNYKTIVKKGG